jgi:transposase
MSSERKTYDKQFKLMYIELSNARTDLAKELRITAPWLYRWRKEYSEKSGSSFPGNSKVDLQQ